MGSSKETTGFPEGTQWFPTGFIVIPGMEPNEKDKTMGLTLIREDQKDKALLRKTRQGMLYFSELFSHN